jgi:uncharacterized protein YutE (UPF0331/DUF86 family)
MVRLGNGGAETFEILGEAKILPLVLSEALARMVGVRNILVHGTGMASTVAVPDLLRL